MFNYNSWPEDDNNDNVVDDVMLNNAYVSRILQIKQICLPLVELIYKCL